MKKLILIVGIFLFIAPPLHAQTPPPSGLIPGMFIFDLLRILIPPGSGTPRAPEPTPETVISEEGAVITVTPMPTPLIDEKGNSTGAKPIVPFYCQGDSRWANNCSMGQAGCGPTSLSMAISAFGLTMDPPAVDKVWRDRKWRGCNSENSFAERAITSDWLPSMGFKVSPNLAYNNILDLAQARQYIKNGFVIVASSHRYPCVNCKSVPYISHVFVVDDVDEKLAQVSIRDPNNCSYAAGQHGEIQSNRLRNVSAFPWAYAYAIRKEVQ